MTDALNSAKAAAAQPLRPKRQNNEGPNVRLMFSRRTLAEELNAGKKSKIHRLQGCLLYSNEYHILGGDDKAGKSTFAMAMALAAARGESIVPDQPNSAGPVRVGYFDWELSPEAFVERYGELLNDDELSNWFTVFRPKFRDEAWSLDDRIKVILQAIRERVIEHNLQLVVLDNPLAFLPDMSSNREFSKFAEGLNAIIEEVKAMGRWVCFLLPVHLTKQAQDRRNNGNAKEQMSRKTDIRGAGAVSSLAAAVYEIRPSQVDPDKSLLMLWDTRHDRPDFDTTKKAIAFRSIKEPGNWRLEYEGLEFISNHFGLNQGQTLNERQDNLQRIQGRVKILHSRGLTSRQIHSELKKEEVQNKRQQAEAIGDPFDDSKVQAPIGLNTIGDLLRGWGLTPNGAK